MRKWFVIVPVALLLALAGLYQLSKARCFQLTGDLICRVETEEKLVALTFDDGPTPWGVEETLAALASKNATGTFFLIGSELEQRPELARQLLDAGHEIGNHSYSHVHNVGRLPGFYREEVGKTDRLLREAGAEPRYFRPPYGQKLHGLPKAVAEAGLTTIMWDVEEEPSLTDPDAYAAHVLDAVRPGSIVLIHPMYRVNETAREALPLIVEGLDARGYRMVGVSELLAQAERRAE